MKLAVIVFLFFSAYVSIVSGQQQPVTKAIIDGRQQLYRQTYTMYQRIDASYFKFYLTLKNYIDRFFIPFGELQTNLNIAYNSIDLSQLSPEVATEFTDVYSMINSTLSQTILYGTMYSLSSYGSMMMMSELTPPGMNFKMATQMYMVFSQLLMGMEPKSDECITNILLQLGTLYENYAGKAIALSENAILEIPNYFADSRAYAMNAKLNMNTLNTKITRCGKLASKDICIIEVINQYSCDEYPCLMVDSLNQVWNAVMMAGSQFYQIFYTTDTSNWTMEMQTKSQELLESC